MGSSWGAQCDTGWVRPPSDSQRGTRQSRRGATGIVSARAGLSLRPRDTIEHFSSSIKALQNTRLQLINPTYQTSPPSAASL